MSLGKFAICASFVLLRTLLMRVSKNRIHLKYMEKFEKTGIIKKE